MCVLKPFICYDLLFKTGAFSEIYSAKDVTGESGEFVAIKVQNADFDASVMKWEAMVMSDLSSTNISPKLLFQGHEFGKDYLVMELLTGEDMSALRDRVRTSRGSRIIPLHIASYLTRQMIKCLEPLQRKGYVHRDVKPSNFMRRLITFNSTP